MSRPIGTSILLASMIAVFGFSVATVQAAPSRSRPARAEHAVAGEIRKVDHAAHVLVIRTADGVDETVKFTTHTTVKGLKDVVRVSDATARAGLEGSWAVVRYSGEGVERTAIGVDHAGRKALGVARGSVVKVDEAGTFVVVKVAGGAEETFHFATHAVVDGAHGAGEAAALTVRTIKRGSEVTVHYSEENGRKFVHLLKHA